jgi:hypothetical protein
VRLFCGSRLRPRWFNTQPSGPPRSSHIGRSDAVGRGSGAATRRSGILRPLRPGRIADKQGPHTTPGSTAAGTGSEQRPLHRDAHPATPGPTHPRLLHRRRAEGLSKRELTRCLQRYVARELYQLLAGGFLADPAGLAHGFGDERPTFTGHDVRSTGLASMTAVQLDHFRAGVDAVHVAARPETTGRQQHVPKPPPEPRSSTRSPGRSSVTATNCRTPCWPAAARPAPRAPPPTPHRPPHRTRWSACRRASTGSPPAAASRARSEYRYHLNPRRPRPWVGIVGSSRGDHVRSPFLGSLSHDWAGPARTCPSRRPPPWESTSRTPR